MNKAVPQASPVERVQESFPKLNDASKLLNQESDKLNDSADGFNAALKKLGLGITSWVAFARDRDDNIGFSWSEEIGYTKLSGKWGLAIRTTSHDYSYPEPDIETWPFADAPRLLRIKAAPHIPDLLDKLIEDADKATKEISRHAQNIEALTATIVSMAEQPSKEQ